MSILHRFLPSTAIVAGLTTLLAACSADRPAGPSLDAAPSISAQVLSQSANPYILGSAALPGSFVGFTANNSGRQSTEFWDNLSADNTVSTAQCNIGFYASAAMGADCQNQAPGSTANQGGFTTFFGDGAGSRDATAFLFNGSYTYTATLRGSYAGANSEVGWFTRTGETYAFHPVADWSNKTIGTSVAITTGGLPWGFYIKNDFNPSIGGCASPDTDCSDAENGFGGAPFQQFALFSTATGTTFLVGSEDNRLELLPNGRYEDSDYNDYIWAVTPTPVQAAVCDFVTFGRLVTEQGGTKVVISGNAGGNQPGGGILGEFHIEVNGVDNHVANIDTYGPITSGVFSGPSFPNARIVTGVAKNGVSVELRVWDGGEPGKDTDKVYVKLNGVPVLSPAGQFIDQGNMQYHPQCRGPG